MDYIPQDDCVRCGNRFPMDELAYAAEGGTRLVCYACLRKRMEERTMMNVNEDGRVVFYLSVAADGTVSLWDHEDVAMAQTGEQFVLLVLTEAQSKVVSSAHRKARQEALIDQFSKLGITTVAVIEEAKQALEQLMAQRRAEGRK